MGEASAAATQISGVMQKAADEGRDITDEELNEAEEARRNAEERLKAALG
jgi:hypothetical protein